MKIVRVTTVVIIMLLGFFLGLFGVVVLDIAVDGFNLWKPTPPGIIPDWLRIVGALIGAAVFGVAGYFAQRRMWET